MKIKNHISNFLTIRNLLILCAVFAVLRIVFVLISDEFNTVEDFRIATNIAGGIGFVHIEQLGPTALKAPVYPYFLSIFIYIFGDSATKVIALVQHLLFAFTPLLIYRIGRRLINKKAGIIAGLFFLLYPSYFYYPNVMEVTSLFVPAFVLWLLFFLKAKDDLNFFNSIVLGICSGLIILLQAVILPLILVAFIYITVKKRNKFLFPLFFFFLIFQAIWTTRNYIEFDEFILTKSPFWMNLYVGFLPEHLSSDRFDILETEQKQKIDSLTKILNDVSMEKRYKDEFIYLFTKDPLIYIQKSLNNIVNYWWITSRYSENYSFSFLSVRVFPLTLLMIMSIPGLWIVFERNKYYTFMLLGIFWYFTAIYCLTHTANIRFKLDIEWLQFLLAAETIYYTFFMKTENKEGLSDNN